MKKVKMLVKRAHTHKIMQGLVELVGLLAMVGQCIHVCAKVHVHASMWVGLHKICLSVSHSVSVFYLSPHPSPQL